MDRSNLSRRAEARSHVEAAAWRTQLAEQRIASSDAFDQWLAASDENRRAWQHMQAPWQILTEHANSPELIELRRAALTRVRTVTRQRSQRYLFSRWLRGSLAASVVLALVGVMAFWWISRPDVYETALGERRIVALSDGSKLTLDSLSEVQVTYSERARELRLVRGQARFEVAHDVQRPFLVRVQDYEVLATGTVFNVDHLNRRTYITLLEGKVLVSYSRTEPSMVLLPNEQVVLTPGEAAMRQKVSAEQVTGWESGQLIFENEALASVVERVNRYSARNIEIADARAAALKVTGVFNVGDAESFVTTAAEYLPVKVVQTKNGGLQLIHADESSVTR